jgi:hypothetical protein
MVMRLSTLSLLFADCGVFSILTSVFTSGRSLVGSFDGVAREADRWSSMLDTDTDETNKNKQTTKRRHDAIAVHLYT